MFYDQPWMQVLDPTKKKVELVHITVGLLVMNYLTHV
jgi:hypothetical protein